MEKSIKHLLREGLNMLNLPIKEEEPAPAEKKDEKGRDYEKDYTALQNKLQHSLLKMNQVMHLAGLGKADSSTDRSLFSKKLRRETNDEGGVYSFDKDELASIIKVVNNPASYLGSKKG